MVNYEIPLRNTYARIQKTRIFSMIRDQEPNRDTEAAAVNSLQMELFGSNLFLEGPKMMGYISRNYSRYDCDTPISIIVPGLRNIYYEHIDYFPKEREKILSSILESEPYFYDVYDYPSLRGFRDIRNVSEYQIFGTVTPYDMLHITMEQFVNSINRQQPLIFLLREDPDIFVSLTYTKDDLWDIEYQRSISYVNIPNCNP